LESTDVGVGQILNTDENVKKHIKKCVKTTKKRVKFAKKHSKSSLFEQ